MQQCLATPENVGDATSSAARNDTAQTLHGTLNSPTLELLLGEWARARLVGSSWNDALTAAAGVSIPFCPGMSWT
jgi:hypothetical protein